MKKISMREIFTFLVSVLPFLYQYKSPISIISFGEFVLIPFIIYYFVKNFKFKLPIRVFNGIYIYFIVGIFCTIFASYETHFNFKDFVTVAARILYFSVLIYVCYYEYNFKSGNRYIKICSTIFVIYAIIQYITHLVTSFILPTTFNSNWIFEAEAGERLNYEKYYRWLYRSSSLFLEPGYFISYCTPAVIDIFFLEKMNKKNVILMILFSIGFLVSTSSAGLFIILITWIGFMIKSMCNPQKNNLKIFKFIIIPLIIILLLSLPLSNTVLTRTKGGGSFNNRITRTLMLIDKMNWYQKIFGVGINNVENFVVTNQFYTQYDETGNLGYTSAYFGTIANSGILTFICYNAFFIITFLKNREWYIRMLIIVFLFFNIIGNISYTTSFVYYVILLNGKQKVNFQNNTNKKNKGERNDIFNLCM